MADLADIAYGRSKDVDHNGTPDECEKDGHEPLPTDWIVHHPTDLMVSSEIPPIVTLDCHCPKADHYELVIFGERHRRLKTLFNGTLRTGRYFFYWLPPRRDVLSPTPKRYLAVLLSSQGRLEREFGVQRK
jgi:hypothetical protein